MLCSLIPAMLLQYQHIPTAFNNTDKQVEFDYQTTYHHSLHSLIPIFPLFSHITDVSSDRMNWHWDTDICTGVSTHSDQAERINGHQDTH